MPVMPCSSRLGHGILRPASRRSSSTVHEDLLDVAGIDPNVDHPPDRNAAIAHRAAVLQAASSRPERRSRSAPSDARRLGLAEPDAKPTRPAIRLRTRCRPADSWRGSPCSGPPCRRAARRAAPGAVEIGPKPWMIRSPQIRPIVPTMTRLSTSAATRSLIAQQRVQIVGDHQHGQAQAPLQAADQLVEGGGADRVEARRSARRGTGSRDRAPGRGPARPACACRPTARTGILAQASAAARPARASGAASSSSSAVRQVGVLAHRHLDVLRRRERAEQRAVLEQHAPARAAARRCAASLEPAESWPNTSIAAALRPAAGR